VYNGWLGWSCLKAHGKNCLVCGVWFLSSTNMTYFNKAAQGFERNARQSILHELHQENASCGLQGPTANVEKRR
jgi:hypothetical protein